MDEDKDKDRLGGRPMPEGGGIYFINNNIVH